MFLHSHDIMNQFTHFDVHRMSPGLSKSDVFEMVFGPLEKATHVPSWISLMGELEHLGYFRPGKWWRGKAEAPFPCTSYSASGSGSAYMGNEESLMPD